MAEEAAAVKALVFDVFGTVVDWRGSVAREVRELAKAKGLHVDAGAFALAPIEAATSSTRSIRRLAP